MIDDPTAIDLRTSLDGAVDARPQLLVVDDQTVNVQALFQVFSSDHKVFMATSGEQALALCARRPPDLVLLDVEMPGLNGYEVCQRLKADPATCDIPVIFVTSHSDEAAETRGLDVGAVDFITKPINPRIVRARVKTHLTLKAHADLMRQRAYVDGLTGVFNRRYFDERLAEEWRRAARLQTALSVVLLDVDFFKRYNDRYGHLAGDDCLRRIASTLRCGVKRPADLVARYGGEEFVCLLPDTDRAGVQRVCEELGQHIFMAQIPHADSAVAAVVTVSLGACCIRPSDAQSAAHMLRAADEQLYRAKTNGRHRSCITEMTTGP